VRNGYTITLVNKLPTAQIFDLQVDGLDGAVLSAPDQDQPAGGELPLPAGADTVTDLRLLIHAPAPGRGSTPIDFKLRNPGTGEQTVYHSVFLAPGVSER
jgi:hypothetical protein